MITNNQNEIEHITDKDFIIKVRQNSHTFLIFKPDGNPERLDPQDPNKIINNLKSIVFVGANFFIRKAYMGITFLPIKNNRIIVPYGHRQMDKEKAILLHTISSSDLYPMNVEQVSSEEDLYKELRLGRVPNFVVVDDSIQRRELVSIKQRVPKSFVFVIKVHQEVKKNSKNEKIQFNRKKLLGEKFDASKLRAIDLVKQSDMSLDLYSDNPVFLARIFLRKMELSKMKSLLLEKSLTIQDNIYIQTFLDTMIINENNKEELRQNYKELVKLKNFCDFQMVILQESLDSLERIILEESDKESLNFYNYSIKRYKENAKNKDEEIKYWELEAVVKTRLAEIEQGTAS